MSKWLISGEDPKTQHTIIEAISENAAMQIARDAFGKDATVKAITEEAAAEITDWMENLEEAKVEAVPLGRVILAEHKAIKEHYNLKDVPDDVFRALKSSAFSAGDLDATKEPFPDILRMGLALAGNNRAKMRQWAGSAARMQQFGWEGDDYGAENLGLGDLLDVDKNETGVGPDDILYRCAEFYNVPDDKRKHVGIAVKLLHSTGRRDRVLGIGWAEDYAHILRIVFAACGFVIVV